MTNDEVNSVEQAIEKVRYYARRWKTGRFHCVLKSGCAIEKPRERDTGRTEAMIFICSVIAVFIMNLAYIARVSPGLPCTILFDEDERKLLYCVANRTKEVPEKPYTIAEAAGHIGNPCGPRRAPGDGPPGLKNRLARPAEILHPLRLQGDVRFYGSSLASGGPSIVLADRGRDGSAVNDNRADVSTFYMRPCR
jgi:hypothetical protein